MKCVVIVLAVAAALLQAADAKTFTRCGLVQELRTRNMPGNLADWVCLIEAESSRNTAAEGPPNSDGSRDYGLFQVNSRYWCGQSGAGGDCNVRCSALLDDNIADDVACAKLVYSRMGYSAWVGWNSKCQGALPDISGC